MSALWAGWDTRRRCSSEPAERYAGYLRRLLEGMVGDDAQLVDELPILSAEERAELVYGWNETKAEFPGEKRVHELFEEQAARTPGATAVVFEGEELSYAELNRRANQLARYLRELGVGPDERVAICVERGLEMVIGLLGVWKAGGAYVPLDPSYPEERLRYMLEDSAAVALLTQAHLKSGLPRSRRGWPLWNWRRKAGDGRGCPEGNPDRAGIGLALE